MTLDKFIYSRGIFFPRIRSDAIETTVYHLATKWATLSSLCLLIYWLVSFLRDSEINVHIIIFACLLFSVISTALAYFIFTRKIWRHQSGLKISDTSLSGSIFEILRYIFVILLFNTAAFIFAPDIVAIDYNHIKSAIFIIFSANLNGGLTAFSLGNIVMNASKIYELTKGNLNDDGHI